jgi:hypothetical protein
MTIIHLAMGMPEFDRACLQEGHPVLRLDWGSMDHRARQRSIIENCYFLKADVLFMQLQTPNVVDPSTLKEVRDMGVMVINWTGDVRDPIPQHYIDLAPHVDITAFTNHPDVLTMREMGFDARFLQIGYDPLIYNTLYRPPCRPRVVFIGNDYRDRFPLSQDRREKVDALHHAFRSDFHAYGKGFGKMVLKGTDAEVYKEALIAINLDHFDRAGFFSDRYLRSRACGAYTINGTAMTTEQLIEEVRTALDNPAQTEALGMEQAESTWANDRWNNRVQTIAQWRTSLS